MLLALGPHQFDITHQAIVMGIVHCNLASPSDRFVRDAGDHAAAGAHALAVGRVAPSGVPEMDEAEEAETLASAVAALRARFDHPVAVRTRRASVARACFAEGAAVAHDDSGFGDPDYLPAVVAAGATVVVSAGAHTDVTAPVDIVASTLAERARTAAAGLPAERIVLDAALDTGPAAAGALDLLRNHDCIARLGWPVLFSDRDESAVATSAAHAVAVLRGARILRTREVRAVRRVAEIAALLLRAHDSSDHLGGVS